HSVKHRKRRALLPFKQPVEWIAFRCSRFGSARANAARETSRLNRRNNRRARHNPLGSPHLDYSEVTLRYEKCLRGFVGHHEINMLRSGAFAPKDEADLASLRRCIQEIRFGRLFHYRFDQDKAWFLIRMLCEKLHWIADNYRTDRLRHLDR